MRRSRGSRGIGGGAAFAERRHVDKADLPGVVRLLDVDEQLVRDIFDLRPTEVSLLKRPEPQADALS